MLDSALGQGILNSFSIMIMLQIVFSIYHSKISPYEYFVCTCYCTIACYEIKSMTSYNYFKQIYK